MTFEHCMTLGSEVLWDVVFSSEAGGKDTDHRRAVRRGKKFTNVTFRLRVLAPHPNSVLLSMMDDSKQSWLVPRKGMLSTQLWEERRQMDTCLGRYSTKTLPSNKTSENGNPHSQRFLGFCDPGPSCFFCLLNCFSSTF